MKANEVKRILGITETTLNRYLKLGMLNPIKMNSRNFIYDEKEVYSILNKGKERENIVYTRVSASKQKNDLISQTERVSSFANGMGITISRQLSDIKSGMEFEKRKGFQELLVLVLENKVDRVFIENKDRLTRFGFDLLKEVFRKHGTEIIVLTEVENKTYEQELTDDLLSIIHYYSMKSYSHRRKLNKAYIALKEIK